MLKSQIWPLYQHFSFYFPGNPPPNHPSFISALQCGCIQPLASLERSENNCQQTFVLSWKQFIIFSRRLGDMGVSCNRRKNGNQNYSKTTITITLLHSIHRERYLIQWICNVAIISLKSWSYTKSIFYEKGTKENKDYWAFGFAVNN